MAFDLCWDSAGGARYLRRACVISRVPISIIGTADGRRGRGVHLLRCQSVPARGSACTHGARAST